MTRYRLNWILILGIVFCFLFWALVIRAFADEIHVPCPTQGEPCRVVILSPQEEQLLVAKNGILDTAAQGRQIELGGFAVYFKSKIATAPFGEAKAVPQAQPAPAPAENKPAPPVDSTPK